MMRALFFLLGFLFFIDHLPAQSNNNLADSVQGNAKYLFYLHGKIIEDQGINAYSEEYGQYQYKDIISVFQKNGFITVSEIRKKNADPNTYADNIVIQIKKLLTLGVNSKNITIVGVSKGAIIAMLISTKLKNRGMKYVLVANCNDWVIKNFEIDLYGNILSIYESTDKIGHSCNPIFALSHGLNRTKEVKLELGIGHGIIYKPLKDWIVPSIEWSKE